MEEKLSSSNFQAPDMADLLAYFEARSRALDEEGQPVIDRPTLQFMSLIKFNGVSILPPVMDEGRREEMLLYKHEAIRREKCSRARKREELHTKVQSIVAGLESAFSLKSRSDLPRTNGLYKLLERRAAKQASKASPKHKKSPSASSHKPPADAKQSSEVISKVTSKVPGQLGSKAPAEIIISVTDSGPGTSSPKTASKTTKSSSAGNKQVVSPSRSSSRGSGDSKKKEPTNYKSLGKLGVLSKQKSYSSQHLERAGTHGLQYDSDASTSSAKNLSLSPNSRALLPHPPVGRPPLRGSKMRQSSSTPDLRHIDASVKPEDLKKPLPSKRSLSPKGGRPPSKSEEKIVEKSTGAKVKDPQKVNVNVTKQVSKPESEAGNKVKDVSTNQKMKKTESLKPQANTGRKERTSKAKAYEQQTLQNPLELLEQELSKEEENEMKMRFSRPQAQQFESEVRQELDPIQTATAELFPFLISEEQALATLDSLQSDFASLDQAEALPKDYNGIPLTSLKQQQIIHMLTKLSKALNMEDTLMSTAGSDVSTEPRRQDNVRVQSSGSVSGDPRSVQTGASSRGIVDQGQSGITYMSEESAVNVTQDSTYQNTLSTSAHSRSRMSPTGSSILSSASSVSASRSRMSPKSFKNTVHFSTLVTEISTSASQSYEDKISYRKLDITPKSSENFDEDQTDGHSEQRNIHVHSSSTGLGPDHAVPSAGGNLLSKVALSPSVDSSQGSPGEFPGHHPFENSSPENELNTSDKENEYMPPDHDSSDEHYSGEMNVRPGRNQPVLNVFTAHMPEGPVGENHPAVVKSGLKTEGSSLKEAQEKVLQENPQYFYGTNSADLDRYLQSKVTPSDSITSMQEEITRSYLLSQSKPEMDIFNLGHKFSLKYPNYPVAKSSPVMDNMDDSSIFLQPVIFTNTGGSLQENRSMLEDEENIRSNLQRVQLDTDSEESEEEEEMHDGCTGELDQHHDDSEEADTCQPITDRESLGGSDHSWPIKAQGENVEQNFQENHTETVSVEHFDQGKELVNNEVESSNYFVQQMEDKNPDESDGDHSESYENTETVEPSSDSEHSDNNSVEEESESEHANGGESYGKESVEIVKIETVKEVNDSTSGELNLNYLSEPAGETKVTDNLSDIDFACPQGNEFTHPYLSNQNTATVYASAQSCVKSDQEVDPVKEDGQGCENIVIKEVPENSAAYIEHSAEPVTTEHDTKLVRTTAMEQEEEAKAEHIQRYLNQVHEHSLHKDDDTADDDDLQGLKHHKYDDVMGDIGTLIQSFTASIQSMNHLSQEELFRLQTEQFELIQKKLIEHQRAQLEELFVAQRKEQMSLQREIEDYQNKIKDVDQGSVRSSEISVPPSDILQPQISRSLPQVTQAWQPQPVQNLAKSPPFRIQPVASAVPYQNPNQSFNTSFSTIAPYQDPRVFMVPNIDPRSGVGMVYPLGYVGDPNVSAISQNTSYSTIPQWDPGMVKGNLVNKPQRMDVILSQDPGSSQTSNPFIYPTSPSLYMNPKDRDNASVSDMSGFAKATPKQLVFSNVSTPVQPSRAVSQTVPPQPTKVDNQPVRSQSLKSVNQPVAEPIGKRAIAPPQRKNFSQPEFARDNSSHSQPVRDNSSHFHPAIDVSSHSKPNKAFKPIQHSPVKQTAAQRQAAGRYTVPPEVFDPSMQPKFCRVSAAVKGYLTRRLLKTPKVQDIIKTIEDTRNFAFSFQAETPIKKGSLSREDWTLLERIVNQLQAALLDIHEIFFDLPISERMAIISKARQLEEEKRLRESNRSSVEDVSRSQPRLSKATLKALERKKKAQLAEEAVFGSVEFRPKSAPPTTSSPHPSTDIRALRPLQGQISPITAEQHHISVKEVKERPKTAPERRKSTEPGNKGKKSSSDTNQKSGKPAGGKAGGKSSTSEGKKQKTAAAQKSSAAGSKTKKMDKAWR